MSGGVKHFLSQWVARPWLWWVLVLIWRSVLFFLSGESSLPSGPELPFKDKILHCVYYSGGAFAFILALDGNKKILGSLKGLLLSGFLFTAIVGASDEFHQTFTPGRSGNDPWDWLADIAGGLLGAWIAWLTLQRLKPAPLPA